MADTYVPETFLGQIFHEGEWLDYARGHEPESRRWQAGDRLNRRVVDWIRKENLLIPHAAELVRRAVCEWARVEDGPKVYPPGFHADGWTIAWEGSIDEWAIGFAASKHARDLPVHVEPISTWLLGIYVR